VVATSLMHHFPDNGAFGRKMQLAELDYLMGSEAAQTALAENYVGLPTESTGPGRGAAALGPPRGTARTRVHPGCRPGDHRFQSSTASFNS
jgi:hypothetical protein